MEKVYTGKIEDLELFDASSLAPEVTKRVVFGPGRFWDDYTMRHFSLPAAPLFLITFTTGRIT